MNTVQDFLSIILALGFLIMTVCIVYVSYYLVKALKSITNLSDCLENTTQDIKEKIQTKTLTLIPAFLVAIAVKIMKQASYFATKKKRG